MSDPRTYSKTFIQEFIDMYRNFPCLWKIKSKEYTNKNLRNEAYAVLSEKLKEVETDADKDMVIRKINSLRSAFRREFKKVIESKKLGEVYKPRLWYFNLLLFTANNEVQKIRKYSTEDDHFVAVAMDFDDFNMTHTENTSQHPVQENIEDTSTAPLEMQKLKRTNFKDPSLINDNYNISQHIEDSCEIFGRNVSNKLRNMSHVQRLAAEKIINETLFYGELEKLTIPFAMQFSMSIEKYHENKLSPT